MASDYANSMTGTVANMSCGQIVDSCLYGCFSKPQYVVVYP
jgi:hypothetical protein